MGRHQIQTGGKVHHGRDEIATGAGPGGGPHLRVLNLSTGVELASFYAYDPDFGGGVSVACLRGTRDLMTRQEAARIEVPVLIAVGSADDVAGSASALGAIIPGSEVPNIPNRDHMRAVGDKVYKTGVLDFLSRRG